MEPVNPNEFHIEDIEKSITYWFLTDVGDWSMTWLPSEDDEKWLRSCGVDPL